MIIRLDVDSVRGRRVMTTYDPDTLVQDPAILKDIAKRFGGELALNCAVENSGVIELNQTVELL